MAETSKNITNRKDFFRSVSEKTGLEIKEIKRIYEEGFVPTILDSLNYSDNGKVLIPDIGTIRVGVVPSYAGYDAINEEFILVKTSKRLYFRPRPSFRKKINDVED